MCYNRISRAEQSRAEQSRAEQSRAEQINSANFYAQNLIAGIYKSLSCRGFIPAARRAFCCPNTDKQLKKLTRRRAFFSPESLPPAATGGAT